jgi:hypothetical protein
MNGAASSYGIIGPVRRRAPSTPTHLEIDQPGRIVILAMLPAERSSSLRRW